MRMHLISDNTDTRVGMRLAGIPGEVVHTREEFVEVMDRLLLDPEVGIIIVTEKILALGKDYINRIKAEDKIPLIIEIPDRHFGGKPNNSIGTYISEALGVKI